MTLAEFHEGNHNVFARVERLHHLGVVIEDRCHDRPHDIRGGLRRTDHARCRRCARTGHLRALRGLSASRRRLTALGGGLLLLLCAELRDVLRQRTLFRLGDVEGHCVLALLHGFWRCPLRRAVRPSGLDHAVCVLLPVLRGTGDLLGSWRGGRLLLGRRRPCCICGILRQLLHKENRQRSPRQQRINLHEQRGRGAVFHLHHRLEIQSRDRYAALLEELEKRLPIVVPASQFAAILEHVHRNLPWEITGKDLGDQEAVGEVPLHVLDAVR
mmetsp:Transcript_99614/g.281115  ORF Transcript_99614/g.281115 Transcript_99614/m.281115 type:complete len:271 (-) Transcript_99614:225-1037(-)